MKDCKCGKIPPCYGSLEFVIYEAAKKVNEEWERSCARHSKMIDKLRNKLMEDGFLDDTHDKVYGLNEQMCDIGKTMSDPMESLSEDTERAMLGCCELLAKDASDAKCMMDDIIRRAEENIRLWNDNNKYARLIRKAYECKFGKPKEKDIMKEKKTKKMTKVEAFGYLMYKKVACYNGNEVDIQKKLFEIGFKWCDGTTVEVVGMFDFLLIDDGTFQFTDNVSHFRKHAYDEISSDDILSIEIVDEKYELEFNYDKVVELAKPLMAYLNEVGCQDSIRVSQFGIVHEPMSTLIFGNGIGE